MNLSVELTPANCRCTLGSRNAKARTRTTAQNRKRLCDDGFLLNVSQEQNNACAKRLKQLSLPGYVAVVGSGLSNNIAVNMEELISKMEGASGVSRLRSASGAEAQWSFFDRVYVKNSQLYYDILKEAFNQTKPYEAKAYKRLVQIPFKSFVTLNYDELLPNAFYDSARQRNSQWRFSVYPGKNPILLPSDFSGNNQCLVAIHGCKNQNDSLWYQNLILRWDDYKTHYYGSGPASNIFTYVVVLVADYLALYIHWNLSPRARFKDNN